MVESDSESESSSGGKTNIEAKLKLKPQHIDQLVAQTVVSSHIHYNRHPNQNPLIPAVGISGVNGELVAILYDCVRDLLFQVVALTWLDVSAGCLNTPVIFMLWLLLHHRLF